MGTTLNIAESLTPQRVRRVLPFMRFCVDSEEVFELKKYTIDVAQGNVIDSKWLPNLLFTLNTCMGIMTSYPDEEEPKHQFTVALLLILCQAKNGGEAFRLVSAWEKVLVSVLGGRLGYDANEDVRELLEFIDRITHLTLDRYNGEGVWLPTLVKMAVPALVSYNNAVTIARSIPANHVSSLQGRVTDYGDGAFLSKLLMQLRETS